MAFEPCSIVRILKRRQIKAHSGLFAGSSPKQE
jgi:hypothetical protein